jgi:hypothetical protein
MEQRVLQQELWMGWMEKLGGWMEGWTEKWREARYAETDCRL